MPERQPRLGRLTDELARYADWEGRRAKDAIRGAILGDEAELREIPGGERLAKSTAMATVRLRYAAGNLGEDIVATLPQWLRRAR